MILSLRSLRTVFSFSAILVTAVSFAQQRRVSHTIEIRDRLIAPAANAPQWFDSIAEHKVHGPVQVLLQFEQLPGEAQQLQLRNAGISLMEYIPDLAYTALIGLPMKDTRAITGIRSVISMETAWKMEEGITRELNLNTDKRTKLMVSFVRDVPFDEIEELVKQVQGLVAGKRFAPVNVYEIEMPQDRIRSLAAHPFVKYISLPVRNQPLNYDADASSGASLLSSAAATGGYSLDGTGVTIGVGDNVSAIYHVDARDRIINFNPEGPTMHGVHTTLTAAGNGIMDPRTRGMAPSARILSHLYDIVWAQTPFMFSDYNMTVTNNSYAAIVGDCNNAGVYDQYSQMLDEYQKNYPFVQHVFASGNDGLLQCGPYPVSYHTVTGGYQPSKNVLTVGAMAKDNVIWPKSSRGPVNDGRLKPEIMAYGFGIYSGDIFDNYGHSNGTSMSCPVVAGGLALLEQRYRQLHGNQNAPGSLLKALAMNGATDMGNPGPDFLHGYGLLNLYRSVQMLDNNRYMADSVNNGAARTHNITVPANTAQLKVMLYWHDDPASPLATTTLINNIDLVVTEPGSVVHLPLVLDPSVGNVMNNAVEGVDNRNNSEQVVISNPPAGNYSISVKGTLVPAGKQRYVLVYDFIPAGIKIKQPVAGMPVPGNDSIRVYWDASDDGNGFTLEFSDNNGGSWNVVNNNVPASQRQYVWYTPNISTTQGLFRIRRNNTAHQDVAGTFVINPQPQVQLSADQCPGYMAIEWNTVAGASSYEVLRKIGTDLQPVDTVTATSYILSGLAMDSFCYVGVRPLINGVRGFRSKSVKRLPADGNCSGNISDGDLMVSEVTAPVSGRLLTGTALTGNETLMVGVRNLDDVPAANYRVSCSLNGAAWQTQVVTTPVPANGTAVVSFTGLNLAAAGTYQLRVAVQNLAINDVVNTNDTVTKYIKQLSNDPVDLNNTFTDDFESVPLFTVLKDSIGITPNEHWDYQNSTDSGRLRSFVSSDVLISGQRSVSLDLLVYKPDNQNYLTGTFNLQGYDTASTEARIEFDYKLHGQPKFLDGNEVWVRGNDTQAWRSIYGFDTAATPGQTMGTGSLSVTNALADGAQNFSSSFQVRIGQHDTSLIAMNEYGNGITIDNFRLYSVKNDMQLLRIVSPAKLNCGLDSVALSVLVYNSDNLPQDTVALFYRYDNGPVIRDTIFAIAPKDTVLHVFSTKMNVAGIGQHNIDVWLVAAGDTYLPNDSILNYHFRNQPDITSYPYLEDFEANDGNWFADGFNSSWEYGTPGSTRIKTAASGSKVWATGLEGNYNDNEQSFLYSPCFDVSGLAAPMLSFSLSTDIENCGSALCDAAYMEYSADGISWSRLGASGEGYNWYGGLQVWNDTDTRWRVASIPLPAGIPSLKLRFVFKSDPGAARDGIAIDDIHIFDLKYPVYDGGSVTVSNIVNAGTPVDFLNSNEILAQLQSVSGNPGNVDLETYMHSYVLNPVIRQYHLSRSYVIRSGQDADSVKVRLFITDEEVVRLINDNSCDTCIRARDAYRLGITKYDDADKRIENGSLSDNLNGTYSFIPYTAIQWVPYEKGYYAQIMVNSFSEFWFNTGIPGKRLAAALLYPNPVSDDRINVLWNALPGTEMKLVITDVLGRVVYRADVKAEGYDNRTTFVLPDLEAGVYTVRYFIGDQANTTKILVR